MKTKIQIINIFPWLILTVLILFLNIAYGQNTVSTYSGGNNSSIITTAATFLLLAPDARSAGMGDIGVATSGDVNSMHWNPAKYAFISSSSALGTTYTPWLTRLVNDIGLYYVSGYTKIDNKQTLAASLDYFTYGSILYTDLNANNYGSAHPSEYSFDLSYIRRLSNNFALALAGRYIRSNLGQITTGGGGGQPANGFAADIALYSKKEINLLGTPATASYGIDISNIGTKISYGGSKFDFLPTNLRLGASSNFHLDEASSLAFSLDLNKLLIPSNPILDSSGKIVKGKSTNVGVAKGIFQSFTDAPGGAKQELEEVSYGLGMEYSYNEQLFFRTGYYHENPNFGNRRYLTLGAGFKYSAFGVDFAYLIASQVNPLSNTLRFSLNFYFGDKNLSNSQHQEDIP